MLKKGVPFAWKIAQQKAFDNLKHILINELLLQYPDFSASQGAYLRRPAENRSREGGHPQGWKAQTRREMADEMAW